MLFVNLFTNTGFYNFDYMDNFFKLEITAIFLISNRTFLFNLKFFQTLLRNILLSLLSQLEFRMYRFFNFCLVIGYVSCGHYK